MAGVIDAPELAERLLAAEDQFVAGEWHTALEHVAIALAMAQRRVYPPLPGNEDTLHRWNRRLDPDVGQALDEAWKAFDVSERRIDVLSAWVAPMALGMSPTEYARLTEIAPPAYQTLDGVWHAYVSDEATEADARWALPELARVVFRLWEMRSLLGGDERDAIIRQAGFRTR